MSAMDDSAWAWRAQGACRDEETDDFYPANERELTDTARRCCPGCPVRETCRERGLRHEDFGIWGGLTAADRRRIRRRGRAA
jgi:WhiB family redox-sensing transcriptional regulator